MEPFNGDFIQRHARAAALYNDIQVIHVAADASEEIRKTEHHLNNTEALAEHIVYYKKSSSFLAKFSNYYRVAFLYRKTIRQYIKANGRPDIVHVHIPFMAGVVAIQLKRRFGIPFIITEHWTIYQPQSDVKYREQQPLFKSILSGIVKRSRLLTPVSNNLGVLINEQVAKKKFSVIENVADEKYFFYDENKINTAPFRFIHVSNMTYQKNAEGILDVFTSFSKNFPEAELIIVGSIPEAVKNLVEKTGLNGTKIFLKGEVSYPEVATQLQQAKALLMFSRFENSPCSIIEALCCGVPVIATNVGGIPELVDDTNGLLVDSLDKEALLKAMEQMMIGYVHYNRKKIAELAQSRFSYSVIGKKLDDIYTAIIEERI